MAQAKKSSSVKVKVQKFGTALSGMIMPNIGAIIAWGLTAAIFMTRKKEYSEVVMVGSQTHKLTN